MSEKVKETAREEATYVKNLTNEAVRSGAYVYPLRGIFYFMTHRSLWKPFGRALVPALATAASVFASMFFFTYLPQAAVMAIFNGPLAAFSAILLVLSESSTITNVISKNLFINDALLDTFDGTLISKGMTSTVAQGRKIRSGNDPISRLGKAFAKPFSGLSVKTLIRYFMYLPLNFIPIVGTVLFVILQGKKFGPNAHSRYFQLKQMKKPQKDKFIEERRGAYTSFGVMGTLLEMVPVVGLFFAFTNTVGAALWAADLEQKGTTAPGLREQASKVE